MLKQEFADPILQRIANGEFCQDVAASINLTPGALTHRYCRYPARKPLYRLARSIGAQQRIVKLATARNVLAARRRIPRDYTVPEMIKFGLIDAIIAAEARVKALDAAHAAVRSSDESTAT